MLPTAPHPLNPPLPPKIPAPPHLAHDCSPQLGICLGGGAGGVHDDQGQALIPRRGEARVDGKAEDVRQAKLLHNLLPCDLGVEGGSVEESSQSVAP